MATQTVIDMIVLFVSTGRGYMINEDIVIAATNELEAVWKHIRGLRQTLSSDQKIVVWFLEAVGDSLVTRDWRKPASVCENIERIYKKWKSYVPSKLLEPYIVKSLESEAREPVPKLNFRQFQRLKGQIEITQPKELDTGKYVEDITDINMMSKHRETEHHTMGHTRKDLYWQTINSPSFLITKSTALDESSSINEMVKEFQKLFNKEWKISFESCHTTYTNEHTVRFLSDVVRSVYDAVSKTSNARKTLQKHRRNTMRSLKTLQGLDSSETFKQLKKQRAVEEEPEDISIPLQYIKQDYFETLLRHPVVMYKINNPSCVADVELLASKCVEICWYMCARDPPIHLDFDLGNDLEAPGLFKPFTFPGGRNTDRRTHVVIWPALRLNKGGIILDNGWTMNF
ncbi:hypothetical protein ACF0H5_010089 [Mactra antiquata]